MIDIRPPRIDNAPGLAWKRRKRGWEARWQARTDLVGRGYKPKSMKLWIGKAGELSAVAIRLIQSRCIELQDEMLVWGRGGAAVVGRFDGRLHSLIGCYQTDEDSPYRKLRYVSRRAYDLKLKRLDQQFGQWEIEDIKARTVLRWHEGWSAPDKEGGDPKITIGHDMVGMLRTLIRFGMTILESDQCARLAAVLHEMRFTMGKPRTEALTADQAIAIRAHARARGMPSLSLAQAFQFEGTLRQKDAIGEWVPITEPGISDVTWGNEKWLRGLRWEEIDANLILRHVTSKRLKKVEIDLKLAPMVREELEIFYPGSVSVHWDEKTKQEIVTVRRELLPASGPVIICEATGTPWTDTNFRIRWRAIADELGIPKTVRNMDSRAGAITEAMAAGARPESVRKAAQHSTMQMTHRYSRGDAEEVADVMRTRAAGRNKSGPKAS